MATPSKVRLPDNVPVVRPDGTPDPFFSRQLQLLLDEKANVEDLAQGASDTANAAVPQTRLINTTAPLSGGGDLTADRTLTHDDSGVTAGTYGDASNIPQITVDAKGHITDVTEVAVSGGGGGASSQSWSYGMGERRPFVTVTAAAAGGFSNNPNNCLTPVPVNDFFWGSGSGSASLLFDFGTSGNIVTGFGIFQDTNTTQGTWLVEGSPDNSTWTTLAASFVWTPATVNGTHYKEVTFANSTAYRYYKLRKTSGSVSSTPFVNWIIFKCSPF